MRVLQKNIYAGPHGSHWPGEVWDAPDAEGRLLVADGSASEVDKGTPLAPGIATRQANHAYKVGEQIRDPNGLDQKCVTAGTTGAEAPAFSQPADSLTNDGTVVWQRVAAEPAPAHKAKHKK